MDYIHKDNKFGLVVTMWNQYDDFGYCATGMAKVTDCEVLLKLPLPLECLAKIATYRDGWCGASESDAYWLLSMWQNYKPRQINF